MSNPPKAIREVSRQSDIRTWSRAKLVTAFSSVTGRIKHRVLLRAVIFQAYTKILTGVEPLVGGSLRTFWYRWVHPVRSKLLESDLLSNAMYDTMVIVFYDMVFGKRWIRYSVFGFSDENKSQRFLGGRHGHIVLFGDPNSVSSVFLSEMRRHHEVSVVHTDKYLPGFSYENIANTLIECYGKTTRFRLVSIVGYDPSGDFLASMFQERLGKAGLVSDLYHAIQPYLYSQAERKALGYLLPKTKQAQEWFQRTGGLDDSPEGLEASSLPLERLTFEVSTILSELVAESASS